MAGVAQLKPFTRDFSLDMSRDGFQTCIWQIAPAISGLSYGAMFEHAFKGEHESLKKLLDENNEIVKLKDRNGANLLMLASASKCETTFSLVFSFSKGVLQEKDKGGRNALFYACRVNHLFAGKELLKAHIDVYMIDQCIASEYSNGGPFIELMRPYVNKLLTTSMARQGMAFKETEGDLDAMQQILGPDVVLQHRDIQEAFFARHKPKAMMKDILNDQVTKLEIRSHFTAHPPKTIEEALDWVQDKYVVRLKEKRMRAFLKHCKIEITGEKTEKKTEKKALDTETKKALLSYFLANPPASVQAACDYANKTYGFNPSEETMKVFLAAVDKKRKT